MAVSTSELWRDRVGGLALAAFGCWNIASGQLLPFPTRQKIEGIPAQAIGGILLLIAVLILLRTLPWRGDRE